jgi:hypothetical protein
MSDKGLTNERIANLDLDVGRLQVRLGLAEETIRAHTLMFRAMRRDMGITEECEACGGSGYSTPHWRHTNGECPMCLGTGEL